MDSSSRPTDRRAAVMAAALELFAERGFHGTRVPEIAERAGVATGTIYRYFASKEALVNAIFQEKKRGFTEAASAFAPASEPAEQAMLVWRRLVEWARADVTAFRFLELHHHADYLDATSRALAEQAYAAPLAFLDAARSVGSVRADLPQAAILGLVGGALAGFVRDAEDGMFECTEATIDAAGEAVWRMMAA